MRKSSSTNVPRVERISRPEPVWGRGMRVLVTLFNRVLVFFSSLLVVL